MKIGILQVDGEYPNLALMQICAYHEALGDQVERYKGNLFESEYDKIYASKIFKFSDMPDLPPRAVVGGTGINYHNVLPSGIADHQPSYSLYQECDYHLGFSMKGCRFRCKFCCVPEKEGKPRHNSNIPDLLINPRGKRRLMLLDNDFFGNPDWRPAIEDMIRLKLRVCFVQGLNIRIITPEQAEALTCVNYTNSKFNQKYLTFAWDRFYDRKSVMKGIKICNDAGIPSTKMQFFVLIGFDTTPEQDYDRVMTLRDLGAMPFVMPFNRSDRYQKAFARWVNKRNLFKSCEWKDYKYNPNR